MTQLDALQARGWDVTRGWDYFDECETIALVRSDDTGRFVKVGNPDDLVADRMALAAALVAEGHDLIGLVRDWWENGNTPDFRRRARALLSAVDGAARDAAEREAGQ